MRPTPSHKGTASFTATYFVNSLDQCQLSCNTTYHQYVYAVDSGFLPIELIVTAELPYFTAVYRLCILLVFSLHILLTMDGHRNLNVPHQLSSWYPDDQNVAWDNRAEIPD